MCFQPAVTETSSHCADETRVFFDILTHDDHNSTYILSRSCGEKWTERPVRAGSYGALTFSDKASYYLTRNGFTGAKRLTARTRQINALMYDIDCHGEGALSALPDLTAALYQAFSSDVLPEPSLFVFTGRGLHVYYVFDKATPYRTKNGNVNERGLAYLRDVEAGLADRIRAVISPIEGAELDTSVFDFSRVSRVPGSWNAKANMACTLLSYSTRYYDLASLSAYRDKTAPVSAPRPRTTRVIRFDRLMTARLRKVEELQAHRGFDCRGSRENMCFVFYNTATQIYGPETALSLTLAFNSRFLEPLPSRDIESIKRTVDSVVVACGTHKGERGFYPLSCQNLSDKLNMTAEEAASVGFFASKRVEDRLVAKEATRRRKAKRNSEIVRLYAVEGLTQRQIVTALANTPEKCSLRTVAAVIAEQKAVRARKTALRAAAGKALAMRAAKLVCASEDAKNWHTGCSVVPSRGFSPQPLSATAFRHPCQGLFSLGDSIALQL